jgi:GMP synthase (glutamine-hydrolysing)
VRRICILVTGEPVPSARRLRGSFADMIRCAAAGAWDGEWWDLDATGSEPLAGRQIAGVIITGSPASVTERAPWMLRREAELAALVRGGVPVLGLCFGHQMLAQALGGRVEKNPLGREIGTVNLSWAADPLLGTEGEGLVNMSHVDAVVQVPPGAEVLARTERDRCAAIRFAPSAFGVQFHPEFDAEIVGCYLHERRDRIAAEGQDPVALAQAARDTPAATAVLRRFLRL